MSDVPSPQAGEHEPASYRFDGVVLLTEGEAGQVAVPDLSLVLGAAGVDVLRADGSRVVPMPWQAVTRMAGTDPTTTPDGSPGLVVEVATTERTHRFVVPTPDPDGLRAVLAEAAVVRGKAPRKRRLFRRRSRH